MVSPNLPNGWTTLPFKEAVKRIKSKGVKLKTDDYKQSASIPIVDQGQSLIAGHTNNSSAIFQGPIPVIVFGDHTRNVKYIDFNFAVGADGVVLLKPADSIIPKFFFYWLKSIALHNLGYSRHYKLLNDQFVCFPRDKNEQRNIITKIEQHTFRADEITKLLFASERGIDEYLYGVYADIIEDVDYLPMSEVAPLTRRSIKVDLSAQYPELGIRSFGKGTFHKPALTGKELGSKRIFTIEEGDLLFNIVFAWEGAVAVAKPEDHGRVGSHRFLSCVPQKGIATSSFLCFHFLTEKGLHDLGDASPGGAGRNRTLGLKSLDKIKVPVPPYEKQVWFSRLWEKANTARQLQNELSSSLASFIPALLAKAFRGEL